MRLIFWKKSTRGKKQLFPAALVMRKPGKLRPGNRSSLKSISGCGTISRNVLLFCVECLEVHGLESIILDAKDKINGGKTNV